MQGLVQLTAQSQTICRNAFKCAASLGRLQTGILVSLAFFGQQMEAPLLEPTGNVVHPYQLATAQICA